MHKILVVFLFLLSPFLFLPSRVYGDDKSSFTTQIVSEYKVGEDFSTHIEHLIEIKNLKEFVYAPAFTIEIEGKNVKSIQVEDELGNQIPYEISGDKKKITVLFEDKNAGEGNTKIFLISYNALGIAAPKGELKEISISGLGGLAVINERKIKVIFPETWGNPSIVKPSTFTKFEKSSYEFLGEHTLESGVLLIFGSEQYYSVDLTYNLKNPNIFPAEREIALPPTTAYQDTIIQKINPEPNSMYVDRDGNWLAKFMIPPNETIKIQARVYVKTHLGKRENLVQSQRKKYTKQDEFWETHNKKLQKVAEGLLEPSAILNFVVDSLVYDYKKSATDSKRYGALGALTSPTKAVCLEFSDLFIALARIKGIPARSVEGYAYSSESIIRPSSLVKDILHAWPEYYDEATGRWIMIDPTWTDTTRGLDYFSSLDFDHIAFVVKGESSRYPIPAGAYKTDPKAQDVFVKFIKKDEFNERNTLIITPKVSSYIISFIPSNLDIHVKNSGNTLFGGGEIFINSNFLNFEQKLQIPKIAPGEDKNISLKLTPKSFLTKGEYTITMRFGGQIKNIGVYVSPYPPIRWVIIGGIISAITGSSIIITAKAWGLYVHRRKRHGPLRG